MAASTFTHIKDTIKYIMDTYGNAKLRYGVVVFGESPSLVTMATLNQMQPPRGRPDLKKALEMSVQMFDRFAPVRPNAKKFLVVIMDKGSVNTPDELKGVTMAMEKVPIKVISIIVPPDADEKELKRIVPNKFNVLKKDSSDDPKSLGEKIIDKVVEGTLILNYRLYSYFDVLLIIKL